MSITVQFHILYEIWLILTGYVMHAANELCDRFVVAGFNGNLISYLTQVMNMPLVPASNTLTIFGGTSSFTPLLGALIAESFAGQFWTITVASIIYELVSYPLFLSTIQSPVLITLIPSGFKYERLN